MMNPAVKSLFTVKRVIYKRVQLILTQETVHPVPSIQEPWAFSQIHPQPPIPRRIQHQLLQRCHFAHAITPATISKQLISSMVMAAPYPLRA
jgi:hypothetical protein